MYEVMNQVSGKSLCNSRIEREKGKGMEGPINYDCFLWCFGPLLQTEDDDTDICDRLYRIVYNGGCYTMI